MCEGNSERLNVENPLMLSNQRKSNQISCSSYSIYWAQTTGLGSGLFVQKRKPATLALSIVTATCVSFCISCIFEGQCIIFRL